MKIKSSDIGATLHIEFTCDGRGISPSLSWSDAPDDTKSFALSVTDPDAPIGTFVHWMVHDIPLDKTSVARGEVPGIEVLNDARRMNYFPPCPPSGIHRYIFTVYALNIDKLSSMNSKSDFFNKVNQHTIARAELVSRYSRQR
jgi:hypothetical protein